MTSRLLLVEPSTTMRFVLDNYVQSLGHSVVSVGEYHEAEEALRKQFQSFDDDFDAVILGWPSVAVREADTLTSLLEQDDFQNLPVVVMSTDQRAETRAWVADRPNSSMLAWKAYESVSELLKPGKSTETNGASATAADSLSAAQEQIPVKFDNSDTGVLLIDDSPSIRESLTKVLTIHGYRIEAVATQQEALQVVQEKSIDIAIVDFYLQDETGDEVCRALLNEEPSLMCAILTSTYSDPIIKLSLRAGAVDCLFKNEAGLLGQPATRVFDPTRLPAIGDEPLAAQWANAEHETIDVVVRHVALADSSERMVNFELASAISAQQGTASPTAAAPFRVSLDAASASTAAMPNGRSISAESEQTHAPAVAASAAAVTQPPQTGEETTLVPIPTAQFAQAAQPFLRQLSDYLTVAGVSDEPVSALVLGVMLQAEDGSVRPVSEHPVIAELMYDSIMAIYRRENHVVQLTEHHYSFLLRHIDAPQSYLLTRKIMQLCNDTAIPEEYFSEGQLCVNGCLLALEHHDELTPHELLARAMSGLRAVDVRGVNQALLFDLRRMLPVYPAN